MYREVIMINVNGKDNMGLTAAITGVLSGKDIVILDIGQSVIHDYLSLGILIGVPRHSASEPILKDLLFTAHKLDMNVSFTPIDMEAYETWAGLQKQTRGTIKLLGRQLTAGQITDVAQILAKNQLNIDVITRLSRRVSLQNPDRSPKACVEFKVSGLIGADKLRGELLEVAKRANIDISFQFDSIYYQNRRLVVFDMDSTLVQCEVIDELAKLAKVGDEVSAITEAAMRGEIDFKESLTQRVALLKGLKETTLSQVAKNLPITEGAERLIRTLKKLDYKLGIISGGFDYFGEHLKAMLGFDYVYANKLEVENGVLTGKLVGRIIDSVAKADALKEIAQKENISLEQTVAVGDGANDLLMLETAGLGVAFHAKPVVREAAREAISDIGLDGLLYLMGISEREIDN